jgi:hypothetical protein
MIKPNETVLLGWCDNGLTDGRFTDGIVGSILTGSSKGIVINGAIRVEGNQIGRQRQALFDYWADTIKHDWLLWVDSDISITSDILQKLWQTADKDTCPVVSGVYFVSKDMDGSLLVPYPALFNSISEAEISYVHPLPVDQVIKCDLAGMGLVLMHKSIIQKLRDKYPNQSVFAEQEHVGNAYVSEDIAFFRKLMSVNIPLHAHTGAVATHMKRIHLNTDYYNLYWNSKA